MFGIILLVYVAWQFDTGRIVLLVIGALLALDLAMGVWLGPGDLLDLPHRLRQRRQMLPPRQRELSNAGRGLGLLALLALGGWFVGWPQIEEFLTVAWSAVRLIIG